MTLFSPLVAFDTREFDFMPIEDCDSLAEDQEEKGKRHALPSPPQAFGITTVKP